MLRLLIFFSRWVKKKESEAAAAASFSISIVQCQCLSGWMNAVHGNNFTTTVESAFKVRLLEGFFRFSVHRVGLLVSQNITQTQFFKSTRCFAKLNLCHFNCQLSCVSHYLLFLPLFPRISDNTTRIRHFAFHLNSEQRNLFACRMTGVLLLLFAV